MNSSRSLTVLTALAALCALGPLGALAGCSASPDTLLGEEGSTPGGEPGATTQQGLECSDAPGGRSYVGFDGKPLEATRVNENIAVNRARVKPYAVMESEYQRVLGVVPASLKASAGTFDPPPARWAEEASYSGVSMHTGYELSFEACRAHTATAPEYATAPTEASASTICSQWIRKAWSRSGSPEEIHSCSDLAVTGLASETDARRRWAYVCAAVLSSSQFLTF